MARLTLVATAGQTTATMMGVQELVATFEAALALLVADAASPTQAHVTAVDAAYTAVKAVWAKDFVMDYDRANLTTDSLVRTAVNAALAQAVSVR